MKILISLCLSVAFIWYTQTSPAQINNSTQREVRPKAAITQTVQAVTPEKVTAVQAAAPIQPQPVVEPEVKHSSNGCEAYRSIVEQYDWNVHIMLAVMKAESSCNANAVSPLNRDGKRDYGLLQLHGQYILEPSQNVAAAYRLWKVQGYHAWSAYNHGRHLKYM